jgi:signal peptidase II
MKGRTPSVAVLTAVVAIDQVTKWWVARSLDLHEFRSIIDGCLSLSHVENRGAAFGILSDAHIPYQSVLFSAISILALVAIAVYAVRLPREARLPRLALSLVLGGAVGNLIDRIRLGHVVDFVHAYWGSHQWPDFNMADSAITVGVALLLFDMLRTPERSAETKTGIAGAASPAGRIE